MPAAPEPDRKAGADDHGGSEQMHYASPQLILHAGKQACPTYHAGGAIQGIPGTIAAARVWRERRPSPAVRNRCPRNPPAHAVVLSIDEKRSYGDRKLSTRSK